MAVRKSLAIMVGALVLSASTSPAHAGSSRSPVLMPDGRYRMDVNLLQVDFSHQLLIENFSGETIKVEYTDPTYGYQVATFNSGSSTVPGPFCADISYRQSMPVSVTYSPGQTSQVTGTATYGIIVSPEPTLVASDLERASKVLQKAKAKLKMARTSLRQARAKHDARSVRASVRKVRVAKAKVAEAKQVKSVALKAYRALQAESQYCEAKRVS